MVKYVVTADEMKEYDTNTIEKIGIPAFVLMERAALALLEAIHKNAAGKAEVLIVCGSGNNGADGLALARLLAEEEYEVTVCFVGNPDKITAQFQTQRIILNHYPVNFFEGEEAFGQLKKYVSEKRRFDVVTDAFFGIGLVRTVEGRYAQILQAMNQLSGCKLAVDIASGICADTGKVLGTAFQADLTVTFGFAKRGQYFYPGSDYTGQLTIADIGISEKSFFERKPEMFYFDADPAVYLPARDKAGNKGTFGKVLVIAGFEYTAGAAVLCAGAALQIGAGMVKVLCPLENRAVLQSVLPEVLYGTCETLENSLQWADVVAIGPGLGKSEEAKQALEYVLRHSDHPLIADADAINLISESDEYQKLFAEYGDLKIATPHVGELSRLVKKSIASLKEDLITAAKDCSEKYHCVMVCKDARTIVAAENKALYLNVSGNNGMATAGSGDVLTGIIAGILAQKQDAFLAAATGVYLHGLAGDRAKDTDTEYGVTAMKILKNINRLEG